MAPIEFDELVFGPDDVDLARSPLRPGLRGETFVLGAFNPGLTRLPNGDLLMMVRVAEALREPVAGDRVHAIRWTGAGYRREAFALAGADVSDPRQFRLTAHRYATLALTSLSWLLPVVLTGDGRRVRDVRYDKAVAPSASWQEYGVEDPRISRIGDAYYMTACTVSAERHGTALYRSQDGFDWRLLGLVLDHQNKDMALFEGMIGGAFHALTRPLGECYFAYPEDSPYLPGPSIQLARSPDALHWKPAEAPLIRPRKRARAIKIGGGAPPMRTENGWLVLYHGVERAGEVGVYRTFRALLAADDPGVVLHLEDVAPVLCARPELTAPIAHQMYVSDVVFTSGAVDDGDRFILASGEADLACRITHIRRAALA
jgi:predicted GH43/DUF377 family glycosyl hydrolase